MLVTNDQLAAVGIFCSENRCLAEQLAHKCAAGAGSSLDDAVPIDAFGFQPDAVKFEKPPAAGRIGRRHFDRLVDSSRAGR
jgi:hypothetical protein